MISSKFHLNLNFILFSLPWSIHTSSSYLCQYNQLRIIVIRNNLFSSCYYQCSSSSIIGTIHSFPGWFFFTKTIRLTFSQSYLPLNWTHYLSIVINFCCYPYRDLIHHNMRIFWIGIVKMGNIREVA